MINGGGYDIPIDKLKEYCDEGLTRTEIAVKLCVSPKTVERRCKALGFKYKDPRKATKEENKQRKEKIYALAKSQGLPMPCGMTDPANFEKVHQSKNARYMVKYLDQNGGIVDTSLSNIIKIQNLVSKKIELLEGQQSALLNTQELKQLMEMNVKVLEIRKVYGDITNENDVIQVDANERMEVVVNFNVDNEKGGKSI